jgi:hypothetical protein
MRLLVRTGILATVAWSTRIAAQTSASDSAGAKAQPTTTSALHDAIATADSALFAAFNRRDLTKLRTFFAPDLEFYQDNEGVENYVQTMHDFGQMFGQSSPIRRELIPGSLALYPIKRYGRLKWARIGSATWRTGMTSVGHSNSSISGGEQLRGGRSHAW